MDTAAACVMAAISFHPLARTVGDLYPRLLNYSSGNPNAFATGLVLLFIFICGFLLTSLIRRLTSLETNASKQPAMEKKLEYLVDQLSSKVVSRMVKS